MRLQPFGSVEGRRVHVDTRRGLLQQVLDEGQEKRALHLQVVLAGIELPLEFLEGHVLEERLHDGAEGGIGQQSVEGCRQFVGLNRTNGVEVV